MNPSPHFLWTLNFYIPAVPGYSRGDLRPGECGCGPHRFSDEHRRVLADGAGQVHPTLVEWIGKRVVAHVRGYLVSHTAVSEADLASIHPLVDVQGRIRASKGAVAGGCLECLVIQVRLGIRCDIPELEEVVFLALTGAEFVDRLSDEIELLSRRYAKDNGLPEWMNATGTKATEPQF